MRRLQTHRDAVAKRLRLEVATKTALYRAEAELSKSRADLTRVKNALKLAKAVLAGNLGLPVDWHVIDENEKLISPMEIELEEMKRRAAQNRPELKALALQKNIAEKQIKLAEGDFWPTVSFEGVYSQYDQQPVEGAINRESAWIGLNVNFVIYDGGLRRASVREAEAEKRQVDLMLADRAKQVMVEVENAYLDYITQTGVMESRADQLTFARENFNAVSKQFEHGLANSVDIMDANTLLVTSEVELADVELRCGLAFINLKYTTGSLLNDVQIRLETHPERSDEDTE
ncbi:MAG: TolC family protein [Desulfobacterales bacterium]|nr:TolC family protein [Desulfobacterales bacterium]